MAGLPERERAWTRELVYGTFRLRGRLDHILEERLRRGGTASLQPDVLDTLRLGAYQLLEMGSVPPYAAISQAADMARWAGVGRASGLVNGVLRAVQRQSSEVQYPDIDRDPVGHLSTRGSHPEWLVKRWMARWGAGDVRRLVEANNRIPAVYIRPVGVEVAEAAQRLEDADIAVDTTPLSPDSLRLTDTADVQRALHAVPAVVQDPAAALVVRYAGAPRRGRILDLCAAPGGKALAMASAGARVAAGDRSFSRLGRLRENVARLACDARVDPLVADATRPPFREACADLVLLDVPCSGTGTLRRHPDGRWRMTPADVEALTMVQAAMLDAAAPLVRPGGLLVYATCSLEEEENGLQISAFLDRTPIFAPDESEAPVDASLLDEGGWLRVLPQRTGFDGSFAARLRARP